VVRAAIMGCTILFAVLVGRASNALTSLALAAFLMTVCNPLTLWDISFQLSAGATLGLILFASSLYQYAHHTMAGSGLSRSALPLIKVLTEQSNGDKKIRWQETLLHLYLQLNMHEQALSYATGLTCENCILAKWWRALAHVNLSLGRYKAALADLTIYGYLTPLSAEEQKLWADLNFQLNIPLKAATVYEAMMKEKPDKRLLQKLVTAYQKLDRSEKALEQLNHFGSTAGDPELLMLKGDLFYALKRFNDANNAYCQAAHADFRQAGRAWLLAGYAAWQKNDLSASCHAFKNAAKYSGQRKAALLAMAQLKKTE